MASTALQHATDLPLVSVIVRTYRGRAGFLTACVESIAAQTYPNIEVIVVEDGGNAMLPLIESFASPGHLKLRYFSLPKVGRCIVGNHGLEASQGRYLNFLDDDDQFYPTHIETLVAAIEADPTYACAYAMADEVPTNVIMSDPLQLEEGESRPFPLIKFSRPVLWSRNFAPIQAVLFRRSLYERYGGFDADLDALEDWNLWTRYLTENRALPVAACTSFFRVPADQAKVDARERTFEAFYPLALEKQKDIRIELTPQLFEELALELCEDIATRSRLLWLWNRIQKSELLACAFMALCNVLCMPLVLTRDLLRKVFNAANCDRDVTKVENNQHSAVTTSIFHVRLALMNRLRCRHPFLWTLSVAHNLYWSRQATPLRRLLAWGQKKSTKRGGNANQSRPHFQRQAELVIGSLQGTRR